LPGLILILFWPGAHSLRWPRRWRRGKRRKRKKKEFGGEEKRKEKGGAETRRVCTLFIIFAIRRTVFAVGFPKRSGEKKKDSSAEREGGRERRGKKGGMQRYAACEI